MTQVLWTKALGGHSLAILTRPRPGEWLQGDVDTWQREGIKTAVSMLEPDEALGLGLISEGDVCAAAGIEFMSFPIGDMGQPPSFESVHVLAGGLAARISEGERVGVHCRMSIGRSSVIAAAVLIELGLTATKAFELISEARGLDVPDTTQQREWVEAFEKWLRLQSGATI